VKRKWIPGFFLVSTVYAAAYPVPTEGNWVARNFQFMTGETLPELRLHYTTIGRPQRDSNGKVVNAVLILHGTGGTGPGFLNESFAGELFGPGQLLDGATHYIILPDGIGHGKSSKPSDGMRMQFPKYTYDDMVRAQYLLLTQGLGVNHLRLVLGTSMGAMHTWLWGEKYPEFMDALMPLASAPVAIAGRNWMQRQMRINCIKSDPAWNGGDYTKPPTVGLTCASYIRILMTNGALRLQQQYPTRESAIEMLEKSGPLQADANDIIYEMEASRSYNPAPQLDKIKAPLLAINSADDEINPPELGILEKEIKKVKRGRFVLLPTTEQTRGHGTHSLPAIWGKYLSELLDESR
jgi:homoserine O-acetyltransferase/O-succinyltransferase